MAYIKKKRIRAVKLGQSGVRTRGSSKGKKVKRKIKSGALKRFEIKPSGAVIVTQSGKRHNAGHHSNRQKLVQRGTVSVYGALAKMVRKLMGVYNR